MRLDHRTRHSALNWGMRFSILGLLVITFLVFVDGKFFLRPIQVENALELRTLKQEYRLGETVQIYISFCKRRNVEGAIQWYLIDGTLVTFQQRTVNVFKGCYKDKIIDIERIPMHADTTFGDEMHFEGRMVYAMNSVNKVVIDMKTTSFRVVE